MSQKCYALLSCVATGGLALLYMLYIAGYYVKPILTQKRGVHKIKVNKPGEQMLTKGHLAAELKGGLGNNMWIYSSLYGLAKKSHRQPHVCITYNMSVLFPNLSIPLFSKAKCRKLHPKNSLTLKQKNSPVYFDTEMVRQIKNVKHSHIKICCYLQNVGFFREYIDDLKREFSLAPAQTRRAYKYLHKQLASYKNKTNGFAKSDAIQFVGIHVRRGDMKVFKGINFAPASYFRRAMSYFREKFKDRVLFIVSSADHTWCHTNIVGKDVVFTWENGQKSREEDFSIQVCCNHTIMSLGTFGWWMGFFSQGEVVAYKNWTGTSQFAKWDIPGQRYPDHWQLI